MKRITFANNTLKTYRVSVANTRKTFAYKNFKFENKRVTIANTGATFAI